MPEEKLKSIKKYYQIIYSVALIVFIPLAIIANTVIFTNYFKKNIDQELYNKAISIGQVINVNLLGYFSDPTKIQEQLEKIAKFNPEIKALDIAAPENNTFKAIASLDKSIINQNFDALQNVMAWHQNKPVAFLTTSQNSNTAAPDINFQTTERFWVIVMPLVNEAGEKQALLSMKMSLAAMDELTKRTLTRSYAILAITIFIIILLLASNTKLFEYATLYRKLKEVDQMKDEFISIASHELRTPVTGIKGYVSMILDGNFGAISDKTKESLKMVQSATERLAALVEDLLNVSRIEQGRMQIETKNIEPGEIIKNIVAELKIQADNKQLFLGYKPHAESLPLIAIDPDKFKQVLINIIGNAIKYTAKGGVEVVTRLDDKGNQLQIRVKDTGFGMSAKERERLFEKFYRIQNDKTEKIIGTGLGLWITKQLIELMKGEIVVDSIEDVGTEMTLSFPIIKS